MPTFELLLNVMGYTTTRIEAENEEEARDLFEEGKWKPIGTNLRLEYEINSIEDVTGEEEEEEAPMSQPDMRPRQEEAMLAGAIVADLIRRGWRIDFVLDGQRTTVDVVVDTINH